MHQSHQQDDSQLSGHPAGREIGYESFHVVFLICLDMMVFQIGQIFYTTGPVLHAAHPIVRFLEYSLFLCHIGFYLLHHGV